jgi:hypothetical protein
LTPGAKLAPRREVDARAWSWRQAYFKKQPSVCEKIGQKPSFWQNFCISLTVEQSGSKIWATSSINKKIEHKPNGRNFT